MNDSYPLPTILGMAFGCFGACWAIFTFLIYPYFLNKPRLYIEVRKPLENWTKMQTFLGFSSKNNPTMTDPDEAWYIYEYEWRFELLIINNSEFNASHIKVFQHLLKPKIEFRENIEFHRAIKSHDDLTLSFRISIIVELQGKDREKYDQNYPAIFKDLNLYLEYKNPRGKKFYTNFNFESNKTVFKRKPFNFKSNWIETKNCY